MAALVTSQPRVLGETPVPPVLTQEAKSGFSGRFGKETLRRLFVFFATLRAVGSSPFQTIRLSDLAIVSFGD